MTVEQLIEILNTIPKDYVVVFEEEDIYFEDSSRFVYVDNVKVNHKAKEVRIGEKLEKFEETEETEE